MYVMRTKITGTRDGADWPAPGQSVPADLDPAELDQLLGNGIAGKVPDKAATVAEAESVPAEVGQLPEPETATARAPSSRRRR